MIGSCIRIRAGSQQCPRDLATITGRSQMECGISGVKPMKDPVRLGAEAVVMETTSLSP